MNRPSASPLPILATLVLATGMVSGARAQQADLDAGLRAEVSRLAQEAAAPTTQQPGLRVQVEVGQMDPRLHLAPCQRIQPYLPAGLPAWGRTRIGLKCTQGAKPWNISVPVTVHVFRQALVLRDALPGGTELEAGQLMPAEVDVAAAPGAAVLDFAQAVGRTLSRPLPAGATLRVTDLKARQWFAAGETVRVVANGPGWAAATEGRAMTPGIEGQLVRVRVESGKLLTGKAVADGTVEINL
ncbi:flagellar basal body P-ring formation chaperone FlgA [Ideonella benzenivorans]|uniref:flagellar basal body P-ring formation chaperone FlgA n=1 Tax=Ideonella benzenivorans TaxID=2831643 RepID=UPI001CEDFC2E|nr:flagellar basal body P-ring formation chaperone FlgA [Ideonella benzenivorans]